MFFKALKKAFRHTIPVLAGYIFLGIAFGFLMKTNGYPFWYPIVMSIVIFSGALEFAAVPLFAAPFDPLGTFIMGLMISARHLFYGLPLLKKYEDAGKLRGPLMFLLTDETFSINTTLDPPEGIPGKWFYFSISLLNYLYWNIGTALGALFGSIITFDTTGIDFSLTALFIVLFLEQIKTKQGAISGFMGLIVSFAVLAIFGADKMVIISMLVILVLLLVGKKVIAHE